MTEEHGEPVQRVITEPQDMLRAAAAWLRLAAESIEKANASQSAFEKQQYEDVARKYARMGKLGVDSHMLTRWMFGEGEYVVGKVNNE